jgi:hypothetical protein
VGYSCAHLKIFTHVFDQGNYELIGSLYSTLKKKARNAFALSMVIYALSELCYEKTHSL